MKQKVERCGGFGKKIEEPNGYVEEPSSMKGYFESKYLRD